MTIAFKSPVTSANVNAKLISRTDDQDASGNINFVNGLQVDGIQLDKASGVLDVGGTDGIKLPNGTTAERPSAGNGVIRYNETSNKFEGYENGSWSNIIGATAARSYRAATTTDSITTADDTVSCSGASFTVTLPTAVGNAGKRYTIIHSGTTATQIYTLATTSAQTIGGIASGSYKLVTAGEVLTVESDNANYKIVEHRTATAWASAGTITIQATTTNPTKGSTQTHDVVRWRRIGDSAHFRMNFRQTSATGSNAGSGDYKFVIPSSVGTIDTAKVDVYTTVEGTGYFANAFSVGDVGSGEGTNSYTGNVVVYDSSSVRIFLTGVTDSRVVGSGASPLTAADVYYSLDFIVPMTDWQP